jgi:DNA-binding response OmpR family regulator
LPVLATAPRVAPRDRVAGLFVGGDEYLVKPVGGDELLVGMRRLLARSERSFPAVSRHRGDGLTKRELEVLRLLAEGVERPEYPRLGLVRTSDSEAHLPAPRTDFRDRGPQQAVA